MFTPLDIESTNFKKTPMGYSCTEVDKFLNDIVKDYEYLYKENIELKDKIKALNDGIQYYKSIEETLHNTLVLAEKTADETKAVAHTKAKQIEKEAESKASDMLQSYQRQINDLNQKIEFLKSRFDLTKIKVKQILISELELVLNTKIDDAYDDKININLHLKEENKDSR